MVHPLPHIQQRTLSPIPLSGKPSQKELSRFPIRCQALSALKVQNEFVLNCPHRGSHKATSEFFMREIQNYREGSLMEINFLMHELKFFYVSICFRWQVPSTALRRAVNPQFGVQRPVSDISLQNHASFK